MFFRKKIKKPFEEVTKNVSERYKRGATYDKKGSNKHLHGKEIRELFGKSSFNIKNASISSKVCYVVSKNARLVELKVKQKPLFQEIDHTKSYILLKQTLVNKTGHVYEVVRLVLDGKEIDPKNHEKSAKAIEKLAEKVKTLVKHQESLKAKVKPFWN